MMVPFVRCFVASLVSSVVLAVYIDTLFASIPGGDSGELVAEACKLGHAHPPGYPLFTMLYHYAMHAMDRLDVMKDKSVAWKANALSAGLASMASGVLADSVMELGRYLVSRQQYQQENTFVVVAAGLGMAMAYSFSHLIWLYSIGAEVFALNNFMMAVLVWLTIRYGLAKTEREKELYICLGAFWSGFSMCNQHTSILFEIPLIGWILWTEYTLQKMTVVKFGTWAFLYFLGLAPYAYLPVTLIYNRQQGSWGDTTTLFGFIHHLRRGDYGTFRLYSSASEETVGTLGRIGFYLVDLCTRQALYIIPFFALVTMYYVFVNVLSETQQITKTTPTKRKSGKKKKKKDSNKGAGKFQCGEEEIQEEAGEHHEGDGDQETNAVLDETYPIRSNQLGSILFVTLWFYLFVFHYLNNMPLDNELLIGVQARFWMQPNLLVFLFAGCGAVLVLHHPVLVVKMGGKLTILIQALGALAAIGLGGLQYSSNYYISDQKANSHMENYGRALLSVVPPKSLLIVGYDQQWTSLRYIQQCLGERKDVTIVNGPMLTYSWVGSYHDVYTKDPNKCITFPGNHWVQHGSMAHQTLKGFSTTEFIGANLRSCVGGVYWTGRLPFGSDQVYNNTLAAINVGLVYRSLPLQKNLTGAIDTGILEFGFEKWFNLAIRSWSKTDRELGGFPNQTKYSPETWEWTINRDFADHVCSDASNILQYGIEKSDLNLIALAAFLFERAFVLNQDFMSPGNVKNLGLAFVKLVQSPKGSSFHDESTLYKDTTHIIALFGEQAASPGNDKWKETAAMRGFHYWSIFLNMKNAHLDPSYDTVRSVVAQLQNKKEK